MFTYLKQAAENGEWKYNETVFGLKKFLSLFAVISDCG